MIDPEPHWAEQMASCTATMHKMAREIAELKDRRWCLSRALRAIRQMADKTQRPRPRDEGERLAQITELANAALGEK